MSVNGDVRVDPVNIRGDISVALRGEDGLSAYEVAVKNGFSGTEEEWLESLKGEAARAEAYTNEAKEYWQNAQASAIQSGNSAVESARYRNEAQDIRDAFAPEVADARAAIQAEKEEAEQKKMLVDDAAANAHLDREQADADAAEVRYLYNETISQKNVATDAAERARRYAQGAGGYAIEAKQHSQEAEGFAQQAQAREEQCTVLWENMKTFPDTARLYMEEAGRSATLASQEADKAHSSAVLASQEAYQAGQIKLDMLNYGETLRQDMDACESRTEGYSIQAKEYADLAGASAEMVQNKIDTSVAEAVTEQLAGKLDVNGKAVDSAHADNADEATHADSADDALHADNADEALHAGDADTVNGHTVETSVPPNAVFTDTTYEVMASSELEDGVSTQGRLIDAHTLATFILTIAADVVNNAPEALDTLAELAQALGNDPNFATTVMTEIGKKLDKAGGVVTGDLTVNGTFTGNVTGNVSGSSGSCTGNAATATNLIVKSLGTNYEMNYADFASNTMFAVDSFKADETNSPSYKWTGNDVGDYWLRKHYFGSAQFCVIECISPRWDRVAYGKFWKGVWQGWEIPALSAANAEKLGGYAIASNASANTGPTWGGVPIIKSDGVMEVGRYIDFHSTNNDSADYSARLDANGGRISSSCDIAAPTFVGNLTGTASGNVPLSGGTITGNLTTNGYITCTSSGPNGGGLVINGAPNSSSEGGQIELNAPPNSASTNGLYLDNFNGSLRIFGKASADGTTKTGYGNFLYINPYAGTITGGYTFTGNVTGNCSGSSGSCTGNAATATTASNLAGFLNSNSASPKNCNDITTNGIAYYASNGPATSLGASTNDGGLYSQMYNGAWGGQIAQDYRNGSLFVRGKNNGSWTAWKRMVWNEGTWGINITGSSASCTGNAATASRAEITQQSHLAAGFYNTVYADYGQNNVGGMRIGFDAYNDSANSETGKLDIDVRGARSRVVVRQWTDWSHWVREATILDPNGNTSFPGNVEGRRFIGRGVHTDAANIYDNSAFEVREKDYVGNTQTAFEYAPSIGFHWSRVCAGSLSMHSDNKWYLRKQDGTTRATLDADIQGNVSGNAASANKINGKTVAVVSSFSNGVLALTGLS